MTLPFESWDSRIQRAEELARKSDATNEILSFYAKLLRSQKEVDEFLRSRLSNTVRLDDS
jgi:formate dehydrogenase maturation protein FdhE